MTDILLEAEKFSLRSDRPAFSPGDSVRVHVKVKEGEKERIQVFAGVVIARRGSGSRSAASCGGCCGSRATTTATPISPITSSARGTIAIAATSGCVDKTLSTSTG